MLLGITSKRAQLLKTAAEQLGIPIFAITDACATKEAEWDIKAIPNASNNQFLACIKHAQFVITDSFHGMCFCIIFRVPFLVILNSKRGGSRMTSLLQRLSLENRMVSENNLTTLKESMLAPIDYNAVALKLNAEINRSLTWLKQALYTEIGPKALSEYDVLDLRMDEEIAMLRKTMSSFREGKRKSLLQRGILCVKENGMKYTMKRFLEKVRHKLMR